MSKLNLKNNKKAMILKQIEKIKMVVEKDYAFDLKARNTKNTRIKVLSIIERILKFIEEYDICLAEEEDILKLRDLIINQKKLDGNNYKITTINNMIQLASKILVELSEYNGLKRIINPDKIKKYMVLPENEKRNLKTYISMLNEPPTLEEFNTLINTNINKDEFEELMGQCLLIVLCNGALRNSAARTLKISSIEFHEEIVKIKQIPSDGVETKFDKNIISYILFSDKKHKDILKKYINMLKEQGFGDNDPLFPVRKVSYPNGQKVLIPTKEFSNRNNYLNKILKKRCEEAKLKRVYTVHSCRHFFAKNVKPYINSATELEACAKSMGHNSMKLLIGTYGKISDKEAENNMKDIQKRIFNENPTDIFEHIKCLKHTLKNEEAKSLLNIIETLEFNKSKPKDA